MVPPQHHGALSGRCTVLRGAPLTATAALSAIHLTGCSPSSPRPGIPAVASAQASEAAVVVPAGWAFEAWGMDFGQRQGCGEGPRTRAHRRGTGAVWFGDSSRMAPQADVP